MLNTLYRTAEALGVAVLYEAPVVGLDCAGGRFRSATVRIGAQTRTIRAKAFVAAAGGFEANIDWLKRSWGDAADNFVIRGTPYNRGEVLKMLLGAGAEAVGDPTQCHAVALDARSPKFDGGIITRLDSIVFGIVVNRDAERFYDEGEDFWPKRYAIWGRLIAAQPDQIAYSVLDAKAQGMFMPPLFPAMESESLAGLAGKLGLPIADFEETVARFNAATRTGTFDHTALDDCRTEGLNPPKSHWARPIDQPPYAAYPLRPGITFTYLGTRVNHDTRVRWSGGTEAENIFAAGEIMAGNVLGKGYAAGIGMTIGSVFGRIAGEKAGEYACRRAFD
jgi:tricarballylate dehydrogenase